MGIKVLVDAEVLRNSLALMETREWPIKYMIALGKVAQEFELALKEVPSEDKSTDED